MRAGAKQPRRSSLPLWPLATENAATLHWWLCPAAEGNYADKLDENARSLIRRTGQTITTLAS
jgi:hypothetical protein